MRFVLLLGLLAPVAALAADPAKPDKTDEDKSLYGMGYIIGVRNLEGLGLSARELKIVEEGISDAATGTKAKVDVDAQMQKIIAFAKARASAGVDKEKAAGLEFAEKAAKEPGAVKIPVEGEGFLVYRTITPGTGATPAATDTVYIDYEGKLTNGSVFDSSYRRGLPAEFLLKQGIKCWTLGVAKMKVGEKAQLICPSNVAYGDEGQPPNIRGGATLVFTVELRSIKSIKGREPAAPQRLQRAGEN
ncbi:MAG: FKBP-type peptidyl-prolyl cis-trans isomerase [Myxococcaceae bacterium]